MSWITFIKDEANKSKYNNERIEKWQPGTFKPEPKIEIDIQQIQQYYCHDFYANFHIQKKDEE